ncbi:hypothetical protein K440DRAFT_633962 [Wilcoxina mikolae CBS 423.85]|nr:hypothetical protein K440DRAFT_633962 [Wilcoxina mikolae CBS 423.85]
MPQPEFSNDRLGILHGITQITQDKSSNRASAPSPKHKSKSNISEPKRERSCSKSADVEDDQRKDSEPRKSKFRFKKKCRRHNGSRHDETQSRHTTEHNGSSKRRRKEYHAPLEDDPSQYDDTYIPNAASWRYDADPDSAFRESLFDAMADDEGAAFWEGVYGQPIHVYDRPGIKDERGELERMSDEEYAKYVREKMWEKSHEHIMEERARRDKMKEKRKKEEEEERLQWEQEERERKIEERMRKEQRAIQKIRKRWEDYTKYWDHLGKGLSNPTNIPWPVTSGKVGDVAKEAVEEFVLAAPRYGGQSLQDVLKMERIRWHPDKAQQRWGMDALTEIKMKAITTVFQTIDALWVDRQKRGDIS